MEKISIPIIVMASINFYVCIYHMVIYFKRPKSREQIYFSFLCLTLCLYDIFSIQLYNSHSIEQGVFWQRLQLGIAQFMALFMILFVKVYTKQKRNKIINFLISSFLIIFALSFILSENLTISVSTPDIKKVNFLNMMNITYYESKIGIIYTVCMVLLVIGYIYLITLIFKHYSKTKNKAVLTVAISQILYFAGMVNDACVSSRIYSFIYISEYSFFIIVCAMSYMLLSEFVTLQNTVETMNINLEKKVDVINSLVSDVRNISQNIVKSAGRIETNSSQAEYSSKMIAQSVGNMAEGVSNQVYQTQDMRKCFDQLSSNLNMIVENTKSVLMITTNAKDLCIESLDTVKKLNFKAQSVDNVTNSVITKVLNLNNDMQQIKAIINMIVSVTSQTKLLALNASIEAAKAGDAGKGFAVVAHEIKKLANQSDNALANINTIVTDIVSRASDVALETSNVSNIISDQMEAVKMTEDSFNDILNGTDRILLNLEKMNELVVNTNEFKEKTVDFIEKVSDISETSAASAEEISATTQEQMAVATELAGLAAELNTMSHSLNDNINKIKS